MNVDRAIVRRATPEDAVSLTALAKQLGYPVTIAEAEERLALLSRHQAHAVFVAEPDTRGVTGWIHVFSALRIGSAPFAEIGGLVVDESCRGIGIGRLLIAAAERWSREHRLGKLRVRSNVVREDARLFYEHLGFENTKSQVVFAKDLPEELDAGRND